MSDTTDRDQLAELLADNWNPDRDPILTAMFRDYAQTILVEGWRPPARTVTTVQELDALPEGTVVIVAGEPYVRTFYFWIEGGYMSPWERSSEEMLRDVGDVFTVIYEPKEGE